MPHAQQDQRKHHVATLARVLDGGDPPSEWRLFKPGANDTEKGVFHFTHDSATAVMADANAWGNEHSADYEHAAVLAFEAPAAAWYELTTRDTPDGPELWAVNIRWTDKAAEYISAREYRYISPAFEVDEDGVIVAFINFALTNIPATRSMDALIAASKRLDPQEAGKEDRMSTENVRLMQALGLRPDANEQAAVEALAPLQEAHRTMQALARVLPDGADPVGTVTAWRDGAQQAETLRAQIEEQNTQAAKARVDELIEAGKRDGKLTPASATALLSALADENEKVDPKRLEAYLTAAPKVITLGGRHEQPAGSADATGTPPTPNVREDGKTEYEHLRDTHGHAHIATLRTSQPEEFQRILTAHRAARYAS